MIPVKNLMLQALKWYVTVIHRILPRNFLGRYSSSFNSNHRSQQLTPGSFISAHQIDYWESTACVRATQTSSLSQICVTNRFGRRLCRILRWLSGIFAKQDWILTIRWHWLHHKFWYLRNIKSEKNSWRRHSFIKHVCNNPPSDEEKNTHNDGQTRNCKYN